MKLSYEELEFLSELLYEYISENPESEFLNNLLYKLYKNKGKDSINFK